MREMIMEMQNELKDDIASGMIFGLRLIKTDIEVIKDNTYAEIFETVREISKFDNEKFFLKTRRRSPHYVKGEYDGKNYRKPDYSIPTFDYEECEAYYGAFDYYDGHLLRSIQEIPAAVNQKDAIRITEYEVIRSY